MDRLAVLFVAVGSTGLVAHTPARSVSVPTLPGDAPVMVIVALPALRIVPRLQVTVPPLCVQLPCEGVAEMKLTPAGSVFVTLTLLAVVGPRLVTVML